MELGLRSDYRPSLYRNPFAEVSLLVDLFVSRMQAVVGEACRFILLRLCQLKGDGVLIGET